jgi:peptide/nickel transport system permease protein
VTAYLVRRLLISLPVLVGITFIAFAALSLAPGDPLTARVDPSILAQQSAEWLAQRRHELGLDQPLPIRYARWLVGVVQGDLGYSIVSRRPIADELALRLPATLQLMGAALLIGVVVGVPAGVLSAVKQCAWPDYALTALSMATISTPTFFLGMAAIYLFGVYLRILPTADIATLGAPPSLVDRLAHLVLPATILGLGNAALVAGAVVTEQIFAWPGMGSMAVRAAADRDPSLLMGVVLVVGIGVLLSNLLTDLAYAAVDPRIRYR